MAGVVMDLSCHDASVINPLLGTKALETVTIEYFARTVVGDGRPVVDGQNAVNALAVCPSIPDSAHTGTRMPVDFQ